MYAAFPIITCVLGSKLPYISKCIEIVLIATRLLTPTQTEGDGPSALDDSCLCARSPQVLCSRASCSAIGIEFVTTTHEVISGGLRKELIVHFNVDKQRAGDNISRRAHVPKGRGCGF